MCWVAALKDMLVDEWSSVALSSGVRDGYRVGKSEIILCSKNHRVRTRLKEGPGEFLKKSR